MEWWTDTINICESESHSVVSDSLRPRGLYSPWNSPGQNTGVGSLFLLQGIFPTQGLNPGLPHCRWILYQLGHKGSPRILEWVAYPFSSGSSWPRNQTGVSCVLQADSLPSELWGKTNFCEWENYWWRRGKQSELCSCCLHFQIKKKKSNLLSFLLQLGSLLHTILSIPHLPHEKTEASRIQPYGTCPRSHSW